MEIFYEMDDNGRSKLIALTMIMYLYLSQDYDDYLFGVLKQIF